MKIRDDLYGLVVCGGKSTRMGSDKGFLVYHEQPQCYHLAEMLGGKDNLLCSQVFISCNETQTGLFSKDYYVLTDLPQYQNNGPIASLLTALSAYSGKNFLVIGCDYPYVQTKDLADFIESIPQNALAAAFYNDEDKYEPLLAWYSHKTAPLLESFYNAGGRSLQHFLRENTAEQYRPVNQFVMTSVDTPEAFAAAKVALNNQKTASL